jgi:hypothetical protein
VKKPDPLREARKLLGRITSMQVNAGPHVSAAVLERFIGAEQALLAILIRKSYVSEWLDDAEQAIRKAHGERATPCDCGVCRR